jgi:hypothetical protein
MNTAGGRKKPNSRKEGEMKPSRDLGKEEQVVHR